MINLRHALLLAAVGILSTGAASAQDNTLGRLFYTPDQRSALNANIRTVMKKPKQRIPIPRSVTLSGVVTRSDGERTVWVDGQAYHQGDPDGISVLTNSGDPARAEMKVRGVRKRVPVRVGQQLNPVSGKTSEPYEAPPQGSR
jgi:hypothetical protein